MNTTSQGPWPSRFVWHDMMTTDAERSARFYCSLFGWQFDERVMQGSVYRMILAGPGPIGGIIEEKGIPFPNWLPYIAVDDVDTTAKKITANGGKVCVGPMEIPNTGRLAIVNDPLGAWFAIYKGNAESAGADPDQPVPGRICWNELLSTDAEAAQRFYSAVFGWQPQPKDMGPYGLYRIQMLGDKQAAGLMQNPQNGAPSAWLSYFLTMHLQGDTELAKSLGGTPLMENAPIPGLGAFSMLKDPTGAVFALFEPNMAANENC